MINLKHTSLWAVPVPKEASEAHTYPNNIHLLNSNGEVIKDIRIDFEFKLVGTCTIDTMDFYPEPFVDVILKRSGSYRNWTNYTGGEELSSSKDSFRSLLTASGVCYVNPLGSLIPSKYDYTGGVVNENKLASDILAWQAAQSKVVDKVVIINKVK